MKLTIRPEVKPYDLADQWSRVDISISQLKLHSWRQDIEKVLWEFEILKSRIEELEKLYIPA